MDWCMWNGINEMIKIFIKILGVNLGNSILNNFKWDKLSKGIAKIIRIWNSVKLFLRDKKIIVNQTLLSKLCYIGQTCTVQKYTNEQYTISSGTGKKIRPLRHLAQLYLYRSGLGVLDIETQLNSLKTKWIKRLLNPTNALWKNLNWILNYNLISLF